MPRIKITVYGLVQGVGFRYHTRQQALSQNLTGYVKNRPNTTVEIVADGPEENIRSLVQWVRQGPARARVDRIEVENCLPINRFDSFIIER